MARTRTLFGVGVVVRDADVLVPGDDESWVVAGVEALLDAGAGDAEPRELEPDKFGSFQWIDPRRPPGGLFLATAALLERLPTGPA